MRAIGRRLRCCICALRPGPGGQVLLLVAMVMSTGLAACSKEDERGPETAHRMIFWANCRETAGLSDGQLDEWKARGIDGFVCVHHHLRGLGGSQQFTGNAEAALAGPAFELQRALRDSRIVERAKAKGLKMYLGFYLVNATHRTTPVADWFDEATWQRTALPAIRDIAGAARTLGFAGVSLDQELYGHSKDVQTWPWDYPGNRRTEAEVRAKVKERGQQVMRAILDGFPRAELLTYHYTFDGDWTSVVQQQYNNISAYGKRSTFINWYDGLSSVEGYRAIRLFNSVFYKLHAPASSWETAFTHEFNTVYTAFSRHLSSWHQASSRIHLAPAVWIDSGSAGSDYDAAQPPEQVAAQLEAMARWSSGGEFVVFSHHGLALTSSGDREAFDYGPYREAMRRTSSPADVATDRPNLSFTAPSDGDTVRTTASDVELRGMATDDMAVRRILWDNDRGGAGAAQTEWQVGCGDYRGEYEGHIAWRVPNVPLQAGPNTIKVTVEDVTGLRTTRSIEVVGASSSPSSDETDPAVRVAAPACNAVLSDRVVVAAEALDNVAVDRVEFLLDGSVVRTVDEPPYAWEWDTTTAGEGQRTLGARAYDSAGRSATSSIPVTVQLPPSRFTVRRTTTAPRIDGELNEYGAARFVSFGTPATTNSVTARALWDDDNLYLAFQVEDGDLRASVTERDGNAWEDDAIEWFVDVQNDAGGSDRPAAPYMRADDHQGIVTVTNVQFDSRGSAAGTPDASWDGRWTSAVVRRGTLNAGSDKDTGYTVEVSIPWASLGLAAAPTENSLLGLSFAVDDRDGAAKNAVMWPDLRSGFQNAGRWHAVRMVGAER